ncbi:MAG: N-acetylglucosamine-6-phosphate deacetylase [Terriglobia bacterium]
MKKGKIMEITANIPGKGLARIQIHGDRIGAVEVQGLIDVQKPYISPGFIDIQLNGFAGIDFCDANLDAKQALLILPALWKTGTSTFCPTLITNSHEHLLHNFHVLEEARRLDWRFAQAVPCYHLEGPYISPGPSHGAHDPRFMRHPDWEEFVELQHAAGGRIGIVTIAPELPGALEFIRRARESGVVVSLGHTDGTPGQIHQGAGAGANLSTHLGNGCPQTIDRHQNTLWPQMAIDQLSASLICDGFHLPPDLVRVILCVKGIERCILITDAVHVAGMPPGRYTLVGLDIELLPSGQVVTANRRSMAGSAISMDRAISIFMQYTGVPLQDAVRAATANPSRLLRRYETCNELAEGQPANLTLFRMNGTALKVEALILGGEVVCGSE